MNGPNRRDKAASLRHAFATTIFLVVITGIPSVWVADVERDRQYQVATLAAVRLSAKPTDAAYGGVAALATINPGQT
jgi:hypothetical protein